MHYILFILLRSKCVNAVQKYSENQTGEILVPQTNPAGPKFAVYNVLHSYQFSLYSTPNYN